MRIEDDSIYVDWHDNKDGQADQGGAASQQQAQQQDVEPQRIELSAVGRSKAVVVMQDATGDIVSFPTKQVELLYDVQSRLSSSSAGGSGSDGLRIMDGKSVLRADEWHGGPVPSDAKVCNNPFFVQFVANLADEAALAKYRLRLYVLAKYGTDDGSVLGYHEAAFRTILALAQQSEDAATQRAACSALGKLARPSREGEVWKKSAYRDRVVSGEGLLTLLNASRSELPDLSRCAAEALRKLVPDMATLLSLLPKVLGDEERVENPLISSWVAYTFFRLVAHRHRASPIARVVKTPTGESSVSRMPYAAALGGKPVNQDVRFPGACRLSIRMLPGSELNEGSDTSGDTLSIYKDAERQEEVVMLRGGQVESRETYEAADTEAVYLHFTYSSSGGGGQGGGQLKLGGGKKGNQAAAPTVATGGGSALGYVCEVVADYPQAEVVFGVPRPYSAQDGMDAGQPPLRIAFEYAEKIHVSFANNCSTDWSGE